MQQRYLFRLVRISYCLLVLAVMAAAFLSSPVIAQNAGLLGELTSKADEPVPPELAFSVTARRLDATRIALDYFIRPGYYLYRDRLSIAMQGTPKMRIVKIDWPATVIKEDKVFGKSQVFKKSFVATVTLEGNTKNPITLTANYQGCFEAVGICYPPETKTLKVAANR
ncbi:protein-disulfide reductase DsbD N-terminal domain-containing protein [Herminiimonas aquatilis]|uniref:Protein-disulfide reductase DsbD N-terminal domain-containing protein n=1 Tax=Herminiimonas aquatilis TaxID=345342 RepID=A0ABW2J7B8_9BURK